MSVFSSYPSDVLILGVVHISFLFVLFWQVLFAKGKNIRFLENTADLPLIYPPNSWVLRPGLSTVLACNKPIYWIALTIVVLLLQKLIYGSVNSSFSLLLSLLNPGSLMSLIHINMDITVMLSPLFINFYKLVDWGGKYSVKWLIYLVFSPNLLWSFILHTSFALMPLIRSPAVYHSHASEPTVLMELVCVFLLLWMIGVLDQHFDRLDVCVHVCLSAMWSIHLGPNLSF